MNPNRPPAPYSGVENLEVMREAVNYNRYLLHMIRYHAAGAKRFIDFGAGSGTFAVPCTELGIDVTAVEPDHRLRALLRDYGVRVVADAVELPDSRFDYAYSLNVLEHIDDDVGALRTLRAKLVPGGRLFIYVPAFPSLYTSMDKKVGHVRRYTLATLRASVAGAGFEIERAYYADALGFVATLLFKTLDNGSGEVNRRLLRIYDRFVFPVSRALDSLTRRWFGKNAILIATNPAASR